MGETMIDTEKNQCAREREREREDGVYQEGREFFKILISIEQI